jgi:hypothetical protein
VGVVAGTKVEAVKASVGVVGKGAYCTLAGACKSAPARACECFLAAVACGAGVVVAERETDIIVKVILYYSNCNLN